MGKIKYQKRTGRLLFRKNGAGAGLDMMDSSGLACLKGLYSLLYELKGDTFGIFRVMRFYDIRFQILIDLKAEKKYLRILETYDSLEQAENDFAILEEDMKGNLGCAIERMELPGRMNLIHRMSCGDAGYISTDSYIHEGDWLQEIYMGQVKEEAAYLEFGSKRKNYYQLSCLRDPLTLLEGIQEPGYGTRYLLLDFAAIPDEGVRLYMEENYLGLELMKNRIRKHSPSLYGVMFGQEKEDQRRFVLAGTCMVRSSPAPDFGQLDRNIFHPCYGIQKKMYQSIRPDGSAGAAQMRVCSSEAAAAFLDRILEGKEQ